MKRNFKIGLILGIALLMLLPVYARAQMSLNFQGGSGGSPGISVANITANSGDTITFVVTCPSLTTPTFEMVTDPWPYLGVASFTAGTATFTWDTNGVPAGPYAAIFEAYYQTQAQQLVVMITINPSTGGSTPPPSSDTTPPTVTAFSLGTPNSLTVPINSFTATDNVLVTGYMVTQSSTKPSASAQGWNATAPTSYTFPAGTAAGSYTLYAWAKDAAGNVSASMSASVSITLPSGGGGTGALGTKTNPVKLDTPMPNYKTWYGYNLNYSTQYTIPMGQSVWFKVDPYGFTGKTNLGVRISVYNYYQKTNVSSYVTRVNRNTGVESTAEYITNLQGYWETAFSADEYYLIELRENGTKDQAMSIWWTFLNFVP